MPLLKYTRGGVAPMLDDDDDDDDQGHAWSIMMYLAPPWHFSKESAYVPLIPRHNGFQLQGYTFN